jgi:hypothetical protein
LYRQATLEPAKVLAWKVERPRHKFEMKAKETAGVWSRRADLTPVVEEAGVPAERYTQIEPRAVVQDVIRRHRYARLVHIPLRFAPEGEPVRLVASLLGNRTTSVSVYYRLAGRGFSFQMLEMKAEPSDNRYYGTLPAARAGNTIYYYLQARDETTHLHGSSKEPHEVTIHSGVQARPQIEHTDLKLAWVGKSVSVAAKIKTALPAAAVRLHYRHLDQAEDWVVREMLPSGASGYAAEIPAEFVVPGWDLMYMIEVVDRGGSGAYFPDMRERMPFIVVPVKKASATR